MYDQFLSLDFLKFDKNAQNGQLFDPLFSSLAGLCAANSKVASQLKHQSYELLTLLQKTSEAINKIAITYKEAVKFEDNVYLKLNFKADETVNATRRKFISGLHEWSAELLSSKKFVNDHMASYFHFQKHESLEFANLLNYKMELTVLQNKKAADLEKLKIKLYQTKDPAKWKIEMNNIQEDFNDLFNDYAKIRPYMLPEVQ